MRRLHWVLLFCALLLLLLAGVGGVLWHAAHQRTGDVHNGDRLPFDASTTTVRPPTTDTANHQHEPFAGESPWPMYGFDTARTRDASSYESLRPPLKVVWKRRQYGVLEYPPSFSDGTLYLATDSGWVRAIDAKTGDPLGSRRLGRGMPDEPALSGDTMYVSSMDGRVYALNRSTGKTRWRRRIGSIAESSPLLYHGLVYAGSFSGQVRALDANTGRVVWTF